MAESSCFELYTLHFKLGRRPFVRNKPNFAGRPSPGERNVRNEPNLACCLGAAEGQMRKTKPIWPGPTDGRVPWGVRDAKQTQFSCQWAQTRGVRRTKQSQTWARWDIWAAPCRAGSARQGLWDVVQTNPIGRSKLCKTNPICCPRHRDQRDRSGETKPIAPWKVSGEDAQPTKSPGPIAPNKPNLGRCGCRAPIVAVSIVPVVGHGTSGNRAKRSQFAATLRGAGPAG
jgi:hypothetical protein